MAIQTYFSRRYFGVAVAASALLCTGMALAQAPVEAAAAGAVVNLDQTVKIAWLDPAVVARTMEGLRFKSFNGEVEMRKTDHQLQQGLFIDRWEKAGGKYPYGAENTGYTFVPVKYYEPYVASTPTSCQMKRPS